MYMQVLPNPYPVPIFRSSTEVNLGKDLLIDPDRKYMVQTLATMLMSYVQRPSLKDCLVVAKALHAKFTFLGDESSEVKLLILLFICTYSLPPPPPPIQTVFSLGPFSIVAPHAFHSPISLMWEPK